MGRSRNLGIARCPSLIPADKDYLWGGRRLIDNYHKHGDGPILAETWELSCHPDGPSTIADGAHQGQTLEQYLSTKGPAVLGRNCARFDHFPVLIKFIDAKQNLSIQVHPNDAYALSHEHSQSRRILIFGRKAVK